MLIISNRTIRVKIGAEIARQYANSQNDLNDGVSLNQIASSWENLDPLLQYAFVKKGQLPQFRLFGINEWLPDERLVKSFSDTLGSIRQTLRDTHPGIHSVLVTRHYFNMAERKIETDGEASHCLPKGSKAAGLYFPDHIHDVMATKSLMDRRKMVNGMSRSVKQEAQSLLSHGLIDEQLAIGE